MVGIVIERFQPGRKGGKRRVRVRGRMEAGRRDDSACIATAERLKDRDSARD